MQVYPLLDRGMGSFGLCCSKISLKPEIPVFVLCLMGHDNGLTDIVLPPTIRCKKGKIILVPSSKVYEVQEHPINCSANSYLQSKMLSYDDMI